MRSSTMFKCIVAVFGFLQAALAADCFTSQARQDSVPTGQQIADAVTKDNQLQDFCSSNIWTYSQTPEFGTSHGSMAFTAQRSNVDMPLQYCLEAFQDIISQCIQNSTFWGGVWSLSGESYNISNTIYPANPLLSSDDGGPPPAASNSAAASSSASTAGAASTTGSAVATSSGAATSSAAATSQLAPQTSSEQGSFTTTTLTVSGLTSFSATTTSLYGHETILPIWFLPPDLGILLIPAAAVIPGGFVPPPPGQPIITFDGDGNPQESTATSTLSSSTTSSSTSSTSSTSCTACSTCASNLDVGIESDADAPIDDGDPDYDPINTNLWSSYDSSIAAAASTTTSSTSSTSSAASASQSARPIDQPDCYPDSDDMQQAYNGFLNVASKSVLHGSDINIGDLYWNLRESVCNGSCVLPDGLDPQYVAIFNENGGCEISIGLTDELEMAMYRATWPSGSDPDWQVQWQQCWDSTENMINGCIDNQAKESWWNGDHVYQFFQTGIRQLNDPEAKRGSDHPITAFLSQSLTPKYCDDQCCQETPPIALGRCLDCVCYDGGLKKRDTLDELDTPDEFDTSNELVKGNSQRITQINGCLLNYLLPSYPSSGQIINSNLLQSVQKWCDADEQTNCDNPTLVQSPTPLSNDYATEHVFELHMVKDFFYFLLSGKSVAMYPAQPTTVIASCDVVQRIFNTAFQDGGPFSSINAAQQMASSISCYGGPACPDNNRISEFFLLRRSINLAKYLAVSGLTDGYKRPTCAPEPDLDTLDKTLSSMKNVALAFQYMQRQEVFDVFNTVNNRMMAVLTSLDAYIQSQSQQLTQGQREAVLPMGLSQYVDAGPDNSNLNWTRAYQYFIADFLTGAERKMSAWQANCVEWYIGNASLLQDPTESAEATALLTQYQAANGIYSAQYSNLGPLYNTLKQG